MKFRISNILALATTVSLLDQGDCFTPLKVSPNMNILNTKNKMPSSTIAGNRRSLKESAVSPLSMVKDLPGTISPSQSNKIMSRKQHEDRNQLNELPVGLLKPTKGDSFLYLDDNDRQWRRNADLYASFHQGMPKWLAIVRSIISMIFLGLWKVPNLKFISQNEDKTYSEACCNRYTGELLLDPQYFGTYNFCKDDGEAMVDGNLPTGGDHEKLDVIPHDEYGANYKHIAKGIPVGYYDNRPTPIILYLEEDSKNRKEG